MKDNFYKELIEEIIEKKSEEDYRLLFENAIEAIVVIQDKTIQICNPIAQRLTGYSEKELTSMTFLDLIYSEDVGNIRDIHNLRLKEESYNYKQINRLVRKDKEIRWIESNGIKINWKGKEAVLNFVIDITERKNAEEALQSSQSQLKDIIEFLPDATRAIDKERRVIIWNTAIEKMTCIPASEMLGKGDYVYNIPFYGEAQPKFIDLVFLEDEEIMTRYPNLTREGDTLSAEMFCPALYNNKGAWVLAKVSPLHDQSGNIIGAIESIRDITEQKRAEEEILESKNSLETLLESIPVPVFYKDINGRYLGFNQAFEDFFGKTKDELIGKSVFDISPVELATIYHAKDVELFEEPGTQTYETQVKDALGILHDVVFYKATMINSFGKVTGLIGTVLDITERKQLETALANEKNLLETTLKSVGDGVISTDNKGNIVFLNKVAEVLTGWTQEAARGKLIEEVFNIVNGDSIREKGENIVKKVIESGKIHELANNTILISKDGIERPIEDSAAPIVQENGEIVGVVLVFRDFSEKNKKQEEIKFLSYHDHLTGLYNRRFYEEELKRLDIKRNLPMTIAMGDVNGLKLINDSFGHVMGDELLKKVAEALNKGCRADDIIARLGGDEFVIILPKTDTFETEQIIKRINDLLLKEKVGSIDISISFGYETKNNEEEKIQEIFKNAEDNMYKKKLFESPSVRGKTIKAIINTLYEKNKREEQHSHRVSLLCKSMGEALGLTEKRNSRT